MKKKTLNKDFKTIAAENIPLELPKHVALKFADISPNWTTDTCVSIICSIKNQHITIESILEEVRHKTHATETRFMAIRKAAYALEGPFILILMIIHHPEIEILSLKQI